MALTQVKTSGIADDAVTLAKQAAGTDGQIITYDASGNPVAVGPGTDGQVLTSTGAGSPPAFEDVPAGGISDIVSDTSPQLGGDLETNGHNILLGDSSNGADDDVIRIGAGQDLNLYHDGTNSWIENKTGNLNIRAKHGEYGVSIIPDGAVELYYDNAKKLETCSTGTILHKEAFITGVEDGDARLYFHADEGDDNADKWQFGAATQGHFYIQNYTSGSWETNIECNGNGNVELYYDNTKVVETSANGLAFPAGKGIDFGAASGSASGSASALLDDYEEGTWTPAFGGTGSAPTLSGYASQTGGWYVKVGRLVTCWFFIYGQTVNSDGSGTLTMTGLPFSASAANDGGEGVATTGWMKVGNECNADDKWAYWRNTGNTNYLKAQSRELFDGTQNNPSQADSLPNDALSVGYISYRTNSV